MHQIASRGTFISKNFPGGGGGGVPPDPAGKLVAFGHTGLLLQTINPT